MAAPVPAASAAAWDPSAVMQLEKAANVLLSPPNVVSSADRQAAESVFIQFRKTPSPFQLCRHILESSNVDYVLFESACLLKEGLIREWQQLTPADLGQLRDYLLQYVLQRATTLAGFVRLRIVQVMAIIVKRQSVDDLGVDRRRVLDEVQGLVAPGQPVQMRLVACGILQALLQEYATTVKSSDVGLPWEVHFKAKKQFELTDLKVIFEFCLRVLHETCAALPAAPPGGGGVPTLPPDAHAVVLHLLTLAEAVLSWSFINVNLPKRLVSVFESDQNPSLRPAALWKDTILQPSIAQLFFQLHLRVRHDSELSHHTMNCLTQLASLNGGVMNKKEDRIEYFNHYLRDFLGLLNQLRQLGAIQPSEALGCSNIVRKLMLFFPPSILKHLPSELIQEYIAQLTRLTCDFITAATRTKQSLDDDSSMFVEAFEHMLEAWVSLLQETNTFPRDFLRPSFVEIFNTYVQCQLAPPDGLRGVRSGAAGDQAVCDDDDDDEIDENEESDRVRFKETLSTIGALGRQAPGHSLLLLAKLLDARLSRLHGQIQRLINQGQRDIDKVLGALYEDIHWLLLITANVVTKDTDGEATMIPSEIMRFSLDQASTVNVEATLRVLASPGHSASEVPGHEATDPVILLISDVFKLAEVEKRALEAGFGSLLSPEISSTIMWFLMRWAVTYLAIQENFYAEISMALVTAFGEDTDGARWTVTFLLQKILSNLHMLNSEPDVVKNTISLLTSIVEYKETGRMVLKSSEGLLGLIDLSVGRSPQSLSLPSTARRGLMKALVAVGSNYEDQASRDQYWEKVLKPLSDNFHALISRPDLKKIYNNDQVRSSVINILESFIGVVQGVEVVTVKQLFAFLTPILANLVELLGLYHNYSGIVELILELFSESARRYLCYLSQADSRILYQRSVDCIQMYANYNQGKRQVGKEAEEEQFRDILLVMELLSNLLSKDFIDLAPNDCDADAAAGQAGLSAAEVCLYGINIIMPMMTLELLKFPSLCLQYFRTVALISEIYPEKICNLQPDLQKNLVVSLELGLTTLGVDTIYCMCCDFVQVLCNYMLRAKKTQGPMYEAMRPFLKLIMDLILSQNINSDLIPNSSSTLYVLLCCYQNTFSELVQYLINAQSDPTTKQRLAEAFEALTRNLPLTGDRMNRIKFRDNFEKFIANVRGFLHVK